MNSRRLFDCIVLTVVLVAVSGSLFASHDAPRSKDPDQNEPRIAPLINGLLPKFDLGKDNAEAQRSTEVFATREADVTLSVTDAFVRAKHEHHQSSGTVLVAHGDKTIYSTSVGYSNVEAKVPVSDKSIFELASLSKPLLGNSAHDAPAAQTRTPADEAADGRASLQSLVRDHATKSGFSGVVRVQRGDIVLAYEAFGLAERRYRVPVQHETRFRIASITKLFTAALMMQQVDEGNVVLDAPIGTYLPSFTGPASSRVTVRHLLTHTSGIPNSDTVKTFEQAVAEGVALYQRPGTLAQLVERHASGQLLAEPGTRFDYNNADYLLLGALLEAVSKKSFTALLAERITGPLGLKATDFPDWRAIEPAIATGYMHLGDGKYINELPVYYENSHAAGALFSTASDVSAFADALYGGRLVSAAALAEMLQGGLEDYGFGQWVSGAKFRGRQDRVAHRPGSIMGANTQLLRYVDDGLTIVILANTNAVNLDEFAFLIGNALTRADANE